MKIAIMVMAANAEPSTRNLDAIQNTLVRYQNEHNDNFKNEYDFYFYWSGGENMKDDVKVSDSTKYPMLLIVSTCFSLELNGFVSQTLIFFPMNILSLYA